MIGAPQVVLIVVAVLLLFGGRKIPELMKGFEVVSKNLKKPPRRRRKLLTLKKKLSNSFTQT